MATTKVNRLTDVCQTKVCENSPFLIFMDALLVYFMKYQEISFVSLHFISRCSAAFFTEERAVLQARRQKIRMLQQRKASEVQDLKDLPEEIPMPLVIGTKVTGK